MRPLRGGSVALRAARPLTAALATAALFLAAAPAPAAAESTVTVSAAGTEVSVEAPVTLPEASAPAGCTSRDVACVSVESGSSGGGSGGGGGGGGGGGTSSSGGGTGAAGGTTTTAKTGTVRTTTSRTASGTASTTARPAVGTNFHAMWSSYTDEQRLAVLDKLAAAGIKWVRVDMGWASFEEACRGCLSTWAVNRADFVVNEARARGINVLAMLWSTPSWANGGAGAYAPPTDPADYGRIANWAATHFRGRVAAWQVWNEPNSTYFFTGADPAKYVALLKAAYPQFKAGDPAAKVVIGGPSYNDTNWLAQVYALGAAGFFDVMSTHPYMAPADLPPETPDPTGTNIWVLSHVAAVKNLMASYGDGAKEIWFTEFGWSSHANAPGTPNWNLGVTDAQQGEYFARTIDYLAQSHPYVTTIFWYTERNDVTGDLQLDNYGLLRRDLAPKPAYETVKSVLAAPPAPAEADLSVTNVDAPDPVTATKVVTYTVEVTNHGPGTATDVLVTVSRPLTDPSAFAAVTASQGGCSLATIATCLLGSLSVGARASVSVTVTALAPGTLGSTATVTASQADPNLANNSAAQSTSVVASADTVFVSVGPDGFSSKSTVVSQGWTLQWDFAGPAGEHWITDDRRMTLIDSGPRLPGSSYAFRFVAAGIYPVRDLVTGHRGTVRVPLVIAPKSGGTATPFLVTWGAEAAAAGYAFDVQIRRPNGVWTSWQTGQTVVRSAAFVADAGPGTYRFRARYRNVANGKFSNWIAGVMTVK